MDIINTYAIYLTVSVDHFVDNGNNTRAKKNPKICICYALFLGMIPNINVFVVESYFVKQANFVEKGYLIPNN